MFEKMLITVLLLSSTCGYVCSSGVAVGPALAPVGPPVVTAASSQYFERTFNRLVAAPAVPVVPVAPAVHAPPVIVQHVPKAVPVPVQPQPNLPVEPNVAIAIATAQAAPVATILLPPYPFGPPPAINFIPSSPPIVVPDEDSRTEPTTTKQVNTQATVREPEATTPLPSNSDNNFIQALPSNQNNQNVGFRQYAPPQFQQLPLEPHNKPQKLKTLVEVEPVPLTYIAPPPLNQLPFQQIRHIHTFVPAKTKIIIRPVSAPLRIHGRPVRIVMYRKPARYTKQRYQNALRRPKSRDIEPTTFSPLAKPNTKPPRQ
ncbi:uncharacterized protein LOC134795789 [Cydia splendana]|uniref:uncharacterized protein LOC134795789 n=1 Tax=Cydia splendana TaxID=1100963 RepID=UPI0021284A27